jgi:hypothetical protein
VKESLVDIIPRGKGHGSWIHEEVALDLACWVSANFGEWMKDQIPKPSQSVEINTDSDSEESSEEDEFEQAETVTTPSTTSYEPIQESGESVENVTNEPEIVNSNSTPESERGILMELQRLVNKPVKKLRKEGDKLAVIDVIMVITGKNNNSSAECLRTLKANNPDVKDKLAKSKFPGRGQKEIDIADIETIVHIIMLLPGEQAKRVRVQASKLLVRYIGGDPTLVDELKVIQEAQRTIEDIPEDQRTAHQQLAAACADTVREAHVPALPPRPIRMEPAEKCLADKERDLYILNIPSQNAYRPGRGDDVNERLVAHKKDYGVETHIAIHAPLYGHLEKEIHRNLLRFRFDPNKELIDKEKVTLDQMQELIQQLQEEALAEAKLLSRRIYRYTPGFELSNGSANPMQDYIQHPSLPQPPPGK